MRIAINASILHGPVTGIAKYLLAAISRFSEYQQHTFFVYLSHEVDLDKLTSSLGDNVIVRRGKTKSRLGKKAWEQLVLPRWSRLDKIDVFWSPSHHLPLFLPKTIKKVMTIHDVVWKAYPQTMPLLNRLAERILMPLSMRVSDTIVTVSKSTADDVVKYWPSFSDKVMVSYPAFNIPQNTSLKLENSVIQTDKYILFVGTIEPRKNLLNLMKAYLKLPREITDDFQLFIVGGEGWGEKEELRQLQEQSAQKIKFLGYISDKELGALYQYASLFILPSFYEGFGLPLVEAMSYGVPVITSNCSSMPEVVDKAAIMIYPDDLESIQKAISNVLTDGNLQESLRVKSKVRANELLSIRPVDELVKIFESS